MRISLAIFTLAVMTFVSNAAPAQLIDFEDLTPTDGSGIIRAGYQGFDWSEGPSGTPGWASFEGYHSMPGTGTAYAYGQRLTMTRKARGFDLLGLDVGSYFYTGQNVHSAAGDNDILKYEHVMTIDATFQLDRFMPCYRDIDRFALWPGNSGTLAAPFEAAHVLCIDNISYEDNPPAPVPEPSTLFILGAGILGFTRLYMKFRVPRQTDLM
jgi:hypothetical protein